MKTRISLKLVPAATVALLAAGAVPAGATPTTTEPGYTTYLSGGWVSPSMLVKIGNGPAINPDSCAATDGYLTEPADPGHELFNSMLLSAYMARRRVSVTIDGCTVLRPRTIAVTIMPD